MDQSNPASFSDRPRAATAFAPAMHEGVVIRGHYIVRCYDTLDLRKELEKRRRGWQRKYGDDAVKAGVEFGFIRNAEELLRWHADIDNLVVNTGLDEYLTRLWKASAYTAQHYLGLTDGTPTVAAADTMSSHSGWVEVTAYSAGTRPDLTASLGSVSGQSLATSSNIAFSINGTATVGGAFTSTNNTKGGTTGTLITAGAFTQGDKPVNSGDTLNVGMTFTTATP